MRWKRSELVLVALIAFSAEAGVKRFDLSNDASTNGEGEIEMEGWLDFGRPADTSHRVNPSVVNGMFWLGLRLGLLDNLELASFLVLEKKSFVALQPEPPAVPPEPGVVAVLSEDQSGIMMWVTDLRWRPVEVGKWPVDVFINAELVHWFEQYHPTQFRFTLGFSKNVGRFLFALNWSYWDSLVMTARDGNPNGARWAWWEVALGASATVVEADGWRPMVNVGVEAWGFIPRGSGGRLHVHNHLLHGGGIVVGPTLSLARGRLWLTGHLGFPVFTPQFNAAGDNIGVGPSTPLVGRITLGVNI